MDIFKIIWKKIPQNIWICFTSGVIFGVLIHLYMLTHKLPNWDDLNNLRGFGSGIEYGRWLLEYMRPLMGIWSVPAFNGMLAIIFWSMSACAIYAALGLETVTSAVLTSLVVLAFPATTSMMTFMFTVSCYALGILFVCIGVWLHGRYKYGFLLTIVFFVLSLATYQSFICLAAGILVFALALDSLKEKSTFKEVFYNGMKSAFVLVASIGIYMMTPKIFIDEITTDRGLNTMGQVQLAHIPRLIARSYKRISEFFLWKPNSFISPFTQFINIAICIMIVLLFVWIIVQNRIYKDKLKLGLSMCLMLMVPLALSSIYILAPETQDATLLMLFQYFFIYVVVIALAEMVLKNIAEDKRNPEKWKIIITKILGIGAMVLVVILGYRYYLVNNEAYFRTSIAFDRAYAYYNRMMMNIESQDGYQYGDDIAILGEFYPDPTPVSKYEIDQSRYTDLSGIAMENGLLTSGARAGFLKIYLGIDMDSLPQETTDEIQETEEYQNMQIYPKEGSIQRIDNVWVVKVHEETSYEKSTLN